jgi:23S rRNA pseudouridine1911/1915/1917 synthase|tara:strand:+ start:1784 stop:2761 length:978 start_codon:yes stop_codon:yes gene_type:complete
VNQPSPTPSDPSIIELTAEVPHDACGRRLDQVASELFSDFSRSRLQQWIKEGQLRVNDQQQVPKQKLLGGEVLTINAELKAEGDWVAEDIPLNIVYEDDHILVINKTANFVVHPAAGNRDGTVLNALLFHCPQLASVPRAGIVHRLDKDTTGLMVVAKTLQAHTDLVSQLQARTVRREYEAVVSGVMIGGGLVNQKIGRHPKQRTKMAVISDGKEARTHYRVLERFEGHTFVRLKLETGRTHQIRVHMAHIRYPIVGDDVYAGRFRIHKGASQTLRDSLSQFGRQALHARELELIHPATGESIGWESELPEDMQALLTVLAAEQA